MLKEGRGAFSRLIAPGVFEIFNAKGVHTATIRLIKGGYIVTFHGATRKQVYKERQAIKAKLAADQLVLLSEEDFVNDNNVKVPNWV